MSAYIIVDISIHDPETYEEYKRLTPATLLPFQGRFVVRGGKTETLEGGWDPQRIVILEFPTAALGKAWWSSEVYAGAKDIRHRAAHSRMILVEGAMP